MCLNCGLYDELFRVWGLRRESAGTNTGQRSVVSVGTHLQRVSFSGSSLVALGVCGLERSCAHGFNTISHSSTCFKVLPITSG